MLKRAFTSLVVLCLLFSANAGNKNPDTLGLFKRATELHKLFLQNLSVKPKISNQAVEEGLQLNGLILNPALYSQLLIDKAIWHRYSGSYDSAIVISYLNLRQKTISTNDSLLLYIKSELAISYLKKGFADSARMYLTNCEKLANKTGNVKESIRTLYFIGALHNSLGEVQEGFSYFKKCHQLAVNYGNEYLIAFSYDGLASCYFMFQKFDSTLHYYLKSLKIYSKLNKKNEEARCYNNLSAIYDEMNNTGLSLNYAQKALELFEYLDSKNDVLLCYLGLTATSINMDNLEKAAEYATKGESLGIELQSLDNLKTIYEYLAEINRRKEKFETALLYTNKATGLQDSLYGLEKIKYIKELETKYETEKKEQENKLLSAESDMHKRRSNFYLIAACLLLIISVLVYFILKQRAKNLKEVAEKNEQLYRKKINEIIKEQELKSINEIMEGQEHERKRIAEDLHDRLGSMLATIKLHFNAVELKIESLELKSVEQYKKANTLLDEVCDEVRKIAHNMESGVLVNFGIIHALTDLKEALEASSTLTINLSHYGMKQRLGNETEITLYRILQELLSNVIKHAKATEVSIDLNRTDNLITVIVSDNGKGYDSNAGNFSEGMGLKNIRSRVAKLHGKFYVDSGLKGGTTNIIEIPLQHDPHSDS